MGTSWSVRRMVRIGSMRSTVPLTALLPELVAMSTRSPTRKGCDTNCGAGAHHNRVDALRASSPNAKVSAQGS